MVDNINILLCPENNQIKRVFYTYMLNNKPYFGNSSMCEKADHSIMICGGVGMPIPQDHKFIYAIEYGKRPLITGAVNDGSIEKIRIKLGFLTLCDVPVLQKQYFYVVVPVQLTDMIDYQYMFAEGINKDGKVVESTKLNLKDLKYGNIFTYTRAMYRGIIGKISSDHRKYN